MTSSDDWLLWQLADTAFPAGALAHANGLEAAQQHGWVTDGPTLDGFVRAGLRQASRGVLRFVQATRGRPDSFAEVDEECDLFLNSHVANRASRAQGRAFLAAAGRVFGNERIGALQQRAREPAATAHLAPIFGVVLGSLDVGPDRTASLFLFMFARGCLSSAVRLGIVGPLEAQQIQSRLKVEELADGPAVQIAPVMDLLQATQDRLYSRLFQS